VHSPLEPVVDSVDGVVMAETVRAMVEAARPAVQTAVRVAGIRSIGGKSNMQLVRHRRDTGPSA